MRWTVAASGWLFALALTACPSRPGPPLTGPPTLTPEARRGEEVYMRFCQECHPGGAGGRGPAVVREPPLPSAAIRLQVRSGVGIMPAFDEQQIGDSDLDALLAYIDALEATVDD